MLQRLSKGLLLPVIVLKKVFSLKIDLIWSVNELDVISSFIWRNER